jgi:hypothetical protein
MNLDFQRLERVRARPVRSATAPLDLRHGGRDPRRRMRSISLTVKGHGSLLATLIVPIGTPGTKHRHTEDRAVAECDRHLPRLSRRGVIENIRGVDDLAPGWLLPLRCHHQWVRVAVRQDGPLLRGTVTRGLGSRRTSYAREKTQDGHELVDFAYSVFKSEPQPMLRSQG